jgi:hypothetical protein
MPEQRPFRIDATAFPLVVHMLDGKQTDEDLDFYLQDVSKVYARRQPFVTIAYVRDYAGEWSHIKRIADRMKTLPLHYCKGSALVISSPTFRFILSSYYLLQVPPHPTVVFELAQPAEEWVAGILKQEGLPVPARLRAAG